MDRLTAALIMVVIVSQFALVSCKKTETPQQPASLQSAEQEQAHEKAMMQKSFDESKKAVAAKVNGETITMFALLREMNAMAPEYLEPGQPLTPEISAQVRKDALNTLITVALAVQEARKRGMKIKPAVIDGEVEKMRERSGSPEAFLNYLETNGLTEDELRSEIEQDALFEQIAGKEIDAKIHVSEAVLRERFQREKAGLTAKDAAHGKMTFEAAKGLLEQKIRGEATEKRMRQWEKELRKNAHIEIVEQRKQG